MTIKDIVINNKDELLTKDLKGLVQFAYQNGMNNRSAFPRFKKALIEIGINYDEIVNQNFNEKSKQIKEKCTHELTLITDASAKHNKFAVCDKNGHPLWYGMFFDNDTDYTGEQSSAELCAAKKAVWLASVAMDPHHIKYLSLTLKVDAEWLCWATDVRGKGGKARELSRLAHNYNIDLHVEHIPGSSNPADKFTRQKGFKKWQENDFSSLCELKK